MATGCSNDDKLINTSRETNCHSQLIVAGFLMESSQ